MSTGAIVGISLAIFFVTAIATALITFIYTRKAFQKQLKENPPVSEKMIRAMFLQMGRKPSESQIKAVMRSMTSAK